MRQAKAMNFGSQNQDQGKLELLNRAKRGDPGARKKLRQMGLLYWEHQGRVIVRRLWPNDIGRNGQMLSLFSRYSRYPMPSNT